MNGKTMHASVGVLVEVLLNLFASLHQFTTLQTNNKIIHILAWADLDVESNYCSKQHKMFPT